MIGNNIFKDISIILWARRKANAFRMQQNERLTPFRCKKLAKNIFELFEMFIGFQELVLIFFPKLFFYPLKPPWNLSSVTDLEKSMPLEVSARKVTEKKKSWWKICAKTWKICDTTVGKPILQDFLVHFLVIPENHMGIPYTSGHRWYRPYRKITKIIFPLLAGSRSYKIFGPLFGHPWKSYGNSLYFRTSLVSSL